MRSEDGWEFDQASHPGMKIRCLSAASQCSKAAVQDSEVAASRQRASTYIKCDGLGSEFAMEYADDRASGWFPR